MPGRLQTYATTSTDERAVPIPTSSPPIWLPDSVHVCVVGPAAVFLDTTRDRYLSVPQSEISAIVQSVRNWPRHAGIEPTETSSESKSALLRSLLSAGLLTTRAPTQSPHSTSQSIGYFSSLASLGDGALADAAVRPIHVLRFAVACMRAHYLLRWRSLGFAIQAVRGMRQRIAPVSQQRNFNVADAQRLVAIFRILRTFCFSSRDRCLFHSVALLTFLSYFDVYPNWVVGVKLDPWGAHSWVQHEHFIFDGNPELVLNYEPILVV